VITREDVLRKSTEVVGDRPDARWTRASLTLRGSDGMSRETFFDQTVEARTGLVTRRITSEAPWSPLLQRHIPKGYGREGTRPICWATCEDTALIYALAAMIGPHVEQRLTDVAIGYRPGRRMLDSITDAIMRARSRSLSVVCVVDIRAFYDTLPWSQLDRVIDELPADDTVKAMLRDLLRVEVHRVEDGTVVRRDRGIPQGLPVSPILANLAMARFDRATAAACGRHGCIVRRYADDIIVLAPDEEAGRKARQLVGRQLGSLGLQVKPGTGQVTDLAHEGTSATWLGIRLWGTLAHGATVIAMDVPEATMEAKALEMRAELQAGLATWSEIDRRLLALESYWSALVPVYQAQVAVRSIRQRVLPLRGQTPGQMARQELVEEVSMRNREVKTTEMMIDELIYPATSSPRTDRRDESGNVGTTRRLTLGVWRRVERVSSMPSPGGGHDALRSRQGGHHGGDVRGAAGEADVASSPELLDVEDCATAGASAAVAVAARVAGQVRGLQLQRPDRPRVTAGRDGVPASPHPARPRKLVTVRAEARGARAVLVTVEREGLAAVPERVRVPDSVSTAEVVLAGFEHALVGLNLAAFGEVVLVTDEPTIAGYIQHGWRVRSFAVLRRLRAIEQLVGATVNGRSEDRRPCGHPGRRG
jgi:retron-type reverse transcriptase